MKVFVTGGTGLVGSNVIRVASQKYGAEVVASMHDRLPAAPVHYKIEKLDIADGAAVLSALRKHKPQLVIHCAATVDIARLEADHELGWRLMVEATRGLARACKQTKAKLIFVSSDWVFGGSRDPYREDTPPCPVNYYGLLKVVGETIVNSSGLDYGIARIAAVYGRNWSFPDWTPQERVTGFGTLPNWMLDTLEKGKDIQEWTRYVNVFANPTLASDCADALLAIFARKQTGIFHCCGRTSISRVELGRLVASTFGFDPGRVTALPDSAMDPSQLSGPLPERTALDVSRTENALGRTNLGVREGLKEWKKQRLEKAS